MFSVTHLLHSFYRIETKTKLPLELFNFMLHRTSLSFFKTFTKKLLYSVLEKLS